MGCIGGRQFLPMNTYSFPHRRVFMNNHKHSNTKKQKQKDGPKLLSDYWERKFLELKTCYFRDDANSMLASPTGSVRRWVDMQRRFYHKGRLTKSQIKLLESIGFSWNPQTSRAEKTPLPAAIAAVSRSYSSTKQCTPPQLDTNTASAALLVVKQQDGSTTSEKIAVPQEVVLALQQQKHDSSYLRKGSILSLFWKDDDCWYDCKIIAKKKQTVSIEYLEGKKIETFDLETERWCLSTSENLNEKKVRRVQSLTLGTRLKVWWGMEQAYFPGTLAKISQKMKLPHYIQYDDGDEEWTNLEHRKFRVKNQ